MSLSRLPLLRTSLARSLHTSTIRSLPAASTSTPVDSSTAAPPTSLSEPHAADAVAGKITGPITERLSAGEITAETISGAPNAMLHRQVRIYQPTKSTMQSAKGKTKRWYLDWDVLQGAGRWENPLMGWASSADYMQGTQMIFKTKEAAVAFAEKQGWDYQVSPPKKAKIPPKNYASNYTHIPGKLRIHHTK